MGAGFPRHPASTLRTVAPRARVSQPTRQSLRNALRDLICLTKEHWCGCCIQQTNIGPVSEQAASSLGRTVDEDTAHLEMLHADLRFSVLHRKLVSR